MPRTTAHLFAVLLTLCCAVALLHVSIAIGSSPRFGDSPHTTQTVRSYYASVNDYLAGGDAQDVPLTTLGILGGQETEGAAQILSATRATYPNLRFEPSEISEAGDLALSHVAAVDGEATLPAWINDGVGQSFPDSIDSLRIENGVVVERQSSARMGVLSQSVAGDGIDFVLKSPSLLKVAELVLSSSGPGGAFVAVAGPGFVLPVEGAFRVTGNGLLHASDPLSGTSRILPTDRETAFSGGEILVIPHGKAVLWPVGDSEVRLLLLAMVSTQPELQNTERYIDPRGPETLQGVLNRLTVEDAREQIWFGSIQVLAVAPGELQPGWLSMDMTRVLVPAGEVVRLSPLGYQLVALVRADSEWTELETLGLSNASGSMMTLETVRTCWRGVESTTNRSCAVQPD